MKKAVSGISLSVTSPRNQWAARSATFYALKSSWSITASLLLLSDFIFTIINVLEVAIPTLPSLFSMQSRRGWIWWGAIVLRHRRQSGKLSHIYGNCAINLWATISMEMYHDMLARGRTRDESRGVIREFAINLSWKAFCSATSWEEEGGGAKLAERSRISRE